jgi:hypothetical protein
MQFFLKKRKKKIMKRSSTKTKESPRRARLYHSLRQGSSTRLSQRKTGRRTNKEKKAKEKKKKGKKQKTNQASVLHETQLLVSPFSAMQTPPSSDK